MPLFHETTGVVNLDAAIRFRAGQFDENIICARVVPMLSIAKAEPGWISESAMRITGVDRVHDESDLRRLQDSDPPLYLRPQLLIKRVRRLLRLTCVND